MNSNDLLLLLPTLFATLSFPLVSSHLTGASVALFSEEVSAVAPNANLTTERTVAYTQEFIRERIKTPFGLYVHEQSFNRTLEVLETDEGKISVESTFDHVLTTVETPKGKLSILQTPTLLEENFSSSVGWLRKSMSNGELTVEKFSPDESSLEARYEEVNITLFSLLKKLAKLRSPIWIVKLKIDTPEFVELRNVGENPINLSGYTLSDATGATFDFPELELGVGECIRVYSHYSGKENETLVGECEVLYWESKKSTGVWNSEGDRAELRDELGRLIFFCEYKESDVENGIVTC